MKLEKFIVTVAAFICFVCLNASQASDVDVLCELYNSVHPTCWRGESVCTWSTPCQESLKGVECNGTSVIRL